MVVRRAVGRGVVLLLLWVLAAPPASVPCADGDGPLQTLAVSRVGAGQGVFAVA